MLTPKKLSNRASSAVLLYVPRRRGRVQIVKHEAQKVDAHEGQRKFKNSWRSRKKGSRQTPAERAPSIGKKSAQHVQKRGVLN